MQLVLSGNRVIAHGKNFLAMDGTVINTETGAKYENATVAECENCPSDIGEVGYEYEAGVFKPCAPYGKGNGEGYVMEVCECATPRNSGIPIKELSRMQLLWENTTPTEDFLYTEIPVDGEYDFLVIEFNVVSAQFVPKGRSARVVYFGEPYIDGTLYNYLMYYRTITYNDGKAKIGNGYSWHVGSIGTTKAPETNARTLIPLKIYGMKFLSM